MPQLEQFHTYIGQIFWLLVTFGILYVVMARVLIPRMVSILEARVFQIESDQRRAEETRLEAEEFGSRIAYMVSNAQMNGDRLRAEVVQEERAKTEKRLAEIEQEIAKNIARSEATLAERHDRHLQDAENKIAEIVEKVLGKVLGSDCPIPADDIRRSVREQLAAQPKMLSKISSEARAPREESPQESPQESAG